MNKTKFYICPKCNNLMTATGNVEMLCCGKKIEALIPKKAENDHVLNIEQVEDELFITSNHDMKKEHYISFIAYLKGDTIFVMKRYPEWNIDFRLQKQGHGRLYFYCTNDGLFYQII